MRTQAKTPVRIEAVKESTRRVDPKNAHHKDNVNVAQGPRSGVQGLTGKRQAFIASKEDRAPLAKVIEDAYARRQHEYADYEYTNGGSIMDNVNEGPKKPKRVK